MNRGLLFKELSKLDVNTILEIGACDFQDSINFKHMYPHSRVIAVEADVENYRRHHKSAEALGIETFHLAISDKDGTTTFYPSLYEKTKKIEWRYAGSILKPLLKDNSDEGINHTVLFDIKGVEVNTSRFDSFCIKNNLDEIDLLFIDVEGAEYKVMNSLGEYRPKLIFSETAHYDKKSYDNDLSLEQYDDMMFSLGYEVIERLEWDTLYKFKN
jgi:FkbM family methyltransferase